MQEYRKWIANQAAAGALASAPISLGDGDSFSATAVFSSAGTLAGDLKVEVSNDDVTYIVSSTVAVAAGANKILTDAVADKFKYVKITWTPSAGTGNLEVYGVVKQLSYK